MIRTASTGASGSRLRSMSSASIQSRKPCSDGAFAASNASAWPSSAATWSRASSPSRASSLRPPAERPRQDRLEELVRRGDSRRARGRRARNSAAAPPASRTADHRVPRRAWARANSASWLSPTNGEVSSAAHVRSSSGWSAKRTRARQSCTASGAVSRSRSTPATGTPKSWSAATSAPTNSPRLRTRTRMSSGRTGRPRAGRSSAVPGSSHAAIWRASRCAICTCAGGSHGASSSVSSSPSPASGASGGHSVTRPIRSARWATCAAIGSSAPNAAWPRSSTTASTTSRIAGTERNERVSSGSRQPSWASRARPRNTSCLSRKIVGSDPWKLKIACLKSPTTNSVRWTSRAPAPAKNSSVSAPTISHCASLVSCASSTSRWSIRLSSLKRTHAAAPASPVSSAAARAIMSS